MWLLRSWEKLTGTSTSTPALARGTGRFRTRRRDSRALSFAIVRTKMAQNAMLLTCMSTLFFPLFSVFWRGFCEILKRWKIYCRSIKGENVSGGLPWEFCELRYLQQLWVWLIIVDRLIVIFLNDFVKLYLRIISETSVGTLLMERFQRVGALCH